MRNRKINFKSAYKNQKVFNEKFLDHLEYFNMLSNLKSIHLYDPAPIEAAIINYIDNRQSLKLNSYRESERILSILSFGKVGTAVLVLAIPMIDAIYTIIRRIHRGASPFKADWGHLHHRLIEIGWGKRRIAVFYWLISFILGLSALFLTGMEKLIAFITIGVVLLVFILIFQRMKNEDLVK